MNDDIIIFDANYEIYRWNVMHGSLMIRNIGATHIWMQMAVTPLLLSGKYIRLYHYIDCMRIDSDATSRHVPSPIILLLVE
jgi:hypothetical protein